MTTTEQGQDGPSLPKLSEAEARLHARLEEHARTIQSAVPLVLAATRGTMRDVVSETGTDAAELIARLGKRDLSADVQDGVAQAEEDLLHVDDAIADGQMVAAIREVDVNAVVSHLRLLSWHLTPQRMERIVTLMRLLCTSTKGKLRPFDEVSDVLIALGATSDVTLETLGAAVKFFDNAQQRLKTLDSLDALFSSGVMTDVYGYRLSLRSQLLEPEVLYASIALDAAFEPHVRMLAFKQSTSPENVAKRMAEAQTDVDKVFKIARRAADAEESFRRRRPKKKSAKAASRSVGAIPIVILALCVIVAVHQFAGWLNDNLDHLNTAELQGISSLLTQGGVSADDGPKTFIGQADKGRWMTLATSAREQEAHHIIDGLKKRGVHNGVITCDGMLVVRIENGRPIQVQ